MKKLVNLKIYGKVQVVFFRRFVEEKARELGLSGFVWNEPDETVGAKAEGEEKELKKLVEYCKEGPKYAKVEKVDVKWREPTNEFTGFTHH